MSATFWQGASIRLRALEMHDIEPLHTLFAADSDLERADDSIAFPTTAALRQRFHEPFVQKDGADGTFFFILEHTQHEIVGTLATFDCDARTGCLKYSIVLARQYWGKGYGQEAIHILLRSYFRELRYQKVTILIYSFNIRSIRFHERLGFQYEGRLRRMVYTNGQFFDEIYYGLTNDEFDQLEPLHTLPLLPSEDESQHGK